MNSLSFFLTFDIIFICLLLLFYESNILESIQGFPFCKVAVKDSATAKIHCYKNQNQRIKNDNSIDSIYTNEIIRITSDSHNITSIMYQEQNYTSYLENVINKSANLTRSYQDEIALWNDHKYSNATMAKITEDYIPKFISQLDQFNKTSAPAKYSKVKDNYVKSFDSEIKSYRLFDIFLKTNNSTANKLSTDYLSSALTFETIARNAYDEANNNSSVIENKDNSLNQLLFRQQPIINKDNTERYLLISS
jgi:hypothetical protein